MILNDFRSFCLEIWLDDSGEGVNVSGLRSINKDKAAEIRDCMQKHRQDIIDQLKSVPKYEIEPMSRCLQQEPCVYLISERGCRPWCAVAGEAIFDMKECPKGLWVEASPVMIQHMGSERQEITADNCPGRCRRTGKCYYEAAFHGKAGRACICHPDYCEYFTGASCLSRSDDKVA